MAWESAATVLKKILTTVELDEDLIKEKNKILHEFLETFINEMKKKDELFLKHYEKMYYTDGYYSGLRISESDEFDISVVLKLPVQCKVSYDESTPSYATCLNQYFINEEYRKWFADGYLNVDNVLCWMQGIVDKALQTYSKPASIHKVVVLGTSGPTRKIKLITESAKSIDMDLVPVFPCYLRQDGFLVPKPWSKSFLSLSKILRLWQTDFPDGEKKLLHNKYCAKPVIKLLKMLKREKKWDSITPYQLKTVVLWMVKGNCSESFWREDVLDKRFEEALQQLRGYIYNGRMPYIFDSRYNLINKMDAAKRYSIVNILDKILNDVQFNPKNFHTLFNC